MAGYTPINYSTPNDGLGDPLRDMAIKCDTMFSELFNTAVFKVAGKDLSSNDFTDLEQTKLSGIAAGAEVNVQSDLAQDDDTQDDFIKNRDSFFNSVPLVIDVTIGVTFGFPAGTQTFDLPENNSIALLVVINGTVQYRSTAGNAGLTNTYVQNTGSITLNEITENNNYIYIEYK